jgi:uncharacterized RDD family membrane protein YckC
MVEHQADPYEGKTFALDLSRMGIREAAQALARSKDKSGVVGEVSAIAEIAVSRVLRKPLAIPILKGRLLRYKKANLAEQASVSKNVLKSVTAGLRDLGFIPVMDRMVESVTPGVFERLFANKEEKLYAIATFGAGGKADVEIIAHTSDAEKVAAVTNRPSDWLDDPGKTTYRLPGASIKALRSAMEYRSPEKTRQGSRFSLKDFLAVIADLHERRFDNAESKRLIVKVKGEAKETAGPPSQPQTAPECHKHPGALAASLCSTCSKPLCLACSARVAGKNMCLSCAPKEMGDSSFPFDISGELTPAGFFLRAFVKTAETGGLLALFAVVFPSGSSAGSVIAFQFIAALTFLSYFTIPLIAWGATPLQRILGVAVVDVETGGIPPLPSAIARSGYLFLTMLALIPLAGYLAALWNPDRRGVHDRIAGTIVLTRASAIKEKAGAVALVLTLVACGMTLKNGGTQTLASIIGRAFGGVAPLGRVDMAAKWRVNGVVSSAYNARGVAAGIIGGALTGFDIETGAPVWKLDGVKAVSVEADTITGAYVFTGKKDGANVVGAVSWKDGAIVWTAQRVGPSRFMGGGPSAVLAFAAPGVAVCDDGQVTTYGRNGKTLWSKEAGGRIVSIGAVGEAFIVELKGKGSVVLNAKTGATLAETEGSPAGNVSPTSHIFAGRGWTKLLFFPQGAGREWTLGHRLSFATEETRAGELYFAREMAVRGMDGAVAFNYPAGCVCVGVVKKMIALSCPMEKKLLLADGASGRILASLAAPAMDTVRLLGEEGGGRLLATAKTQGGFTRVYLLLSRPGFAELAAIEAGEFRNKPLAANLADRGNLLFIAGDGGMGLYDPAPARSARKGDAAK